MVPFMPFYEFLILFLGGIP